MHFSTISIRRSTAAAMRGILGGALLLGLSLLLPAEARGQAVITGGDFDICDFCGSLRSNTMFLRGRAGFGTNLQEFVLWNATTAEGDVDGDGFDPTGVDFTDLIIAQVSPFVNVRDPATVIAPINFVLSDFLNPLRAGFQNAVNIGVNIPLGTPAGVYRGEVQVRDTVRLGNINPNGELLRVDKFQIEIEVLPQSGFGLVQGDAAAALDSLVIRGSPGQTVSDVVRVANLGNTPLTNVRFDATDLIATSGTGLRIRSERISFSPEQIASLAQGDTARVVVTVRIPLGILAGPYRGELIVQADEVGEVRVPLTVIVTTPGGIIFENNPVRGLTTDRAVIVFNADPGTLWQVRIFDMQALMTFKEDGTVFAGATSGTPPVTAPGDQAVRVTWDLKNTRGENVASGMYYVVILAVQDGEMRQLREKLMVIR
jgi:hypothetical protein